MAPGFLACTGLQRAPQGWRANLKVVTNWAGTPKGVYWSDLQQVTRCLGASIPSSQLGSFKTWPPSSSPLFPLRSPGLCASPAIWALWQLSQQNLAQILLCQCPNPDLLKNNRISLYVSWDPHCQDPATMLWVNPTSPWRSPMEWPAPLGQPGEWAILEIHPTASHQIVSAYPKWSRGEPAPQSTSQITDSCGEDLIIGVLGPCLGWAEMQQWPRALHILSLPRGSVTALEWESMKTENSRETQECQHSFYFVLFQGKQAAELWLSQPSQLWPEFREKEVVVKGSKYRR